MESICLSCKRYYEEICGYSPYCTCSNYIPYEELQKCHTKHVKENENIESAMINATNKAKISSHQLLDVLVQNGIMGVYNLGLKHMYEYIKKK